MKLTLKWWPKRGRNHTGSRTEPESELTDKQWFLVADLFEKPEPSPAGGRPRVDARALLRGDRVGAQDRSRWKDLPKHFPSPATCWRRHFEWTELGLLEKAWRRFVAATRPAGATETRRSVRGRHVCERKKGGKRSAGPSAGRGRRSWCWSTATARLSVLAASASLVEISLLETAARPKPVAQGTRAIGL